ncbi:MAG: glycosyltransferase family 8 protein [Pseudomonadota bacterium]
MTPKARFARKLLLNRWTKTSTQRLHGFLSRQLGPASQATAQTSKIAALEKKADTFRARLLRAEHMIRTMRETQAQTPDVKEVPAEDDFVAQLRKGATLEEAFTQLIRKTGTARDRMVGRSLAFRIYDQPQSRPLGALLLGVFMYNDQLYETSHAYFQEVDPETAKTYAPREYFGSWLTVDAAAGRQALLDYVTATGEALTTETANGLVEGLIKHRFYADVRDLMETVPALIKPLQKTDPAVLQQIAWVKDRLAAADVVPPKVTDNQINLAVMDYKLLDRNRTSSNRGDYVQTLASLANICRFQNVTFAGDTPLAKQLEAFKSDIHPDRRLETPSATVVPVPLDRDYASGRQYHPNTWMICNGWFMHRNFRGVIDFPFPSEINPLFISFHINDPDVLTADTIAELRKFEPIGCRDWTTLYRLRDYGVSCFFSGCLTTSIGQILPKAEALPAKTLASVESPADVVEYADWTVVKSSQIGDYVRDFSLTEGIADAKEMLIGYLKTSKIQTSRLHCYLPCRSMGFEVDFRPKNRSDVRFEGLLDLNEADFQAIRTGIETKLETILAAIFAGQSKDEVMALWREICAPDVAAAEAYYAAALPAVPAVDVPAIVQSIPREQARASHADGIAVALALDENLASELPMVLQSIAENTTSPVNVHLVYRGLTPAYLAQVVKAFSDFGLAFYDFTKVDYGNELRLLSHTTEATLDRLYLPEILPEVDKVIYLDIDLLVRGDLKELYAIDLGDNVLAGKYSNMPAWKNAVRLMSRASLKLPPQEAWTMRRRLHQQMHVPAQTFNAGLILMNLKLMRAENFTSRFLHLVTHCYCNDQDVLNIYGAGRVKALPQTWNYVPAQDYDLDPSLIHWAGRAKPWTPGSHVLWQDAYDVAHAAGWARMDAAAPPAG